MAFGSQLGNEASIMFNCKTIVAAMQRQSQSCHATSSVEAVQAACGMADAGHQLSPEKKLNRKAVNGVTVWERKSCKKGNTRSQNPVVKLPHRLHSVSRAQCAMEVAWLSRSTSVTHWGSGLRRVPH